MQNKTKKIYFSLIILSGILIITGTSFAILSLTITGNQENVLRTGSLTLTLEEDNIVTLNNAMPTSDTEGKKSSTPLNFRVENTGNINAWYEVYMEDVDIELPSTRIDNTSVRYQLIVDGIEHKTDSYKTNETLLYSGIINAGEVVEFELRTWLDINLTTIDATDTFKSKLRINGSQEVKCNDGVLIDNTCKSSDMTIKSVSAMKTDTSLTKGTIVQTEGYYEEEKVGGAYYEVTDVEPTDIDNGANITLDNGLYAVLIPANDLVTVDQFGAKGDGINDDSIAIKAAFTSGNKNVSFERTEYKLSTIVLIEEVQNLNIIGNDATLYVTNDYSSDDQALLRFQYCNDIVIDNINIEARHTIDVGYIAQLFILRSEDITITNNNLLVPATVPSTKGYQNLDLYGNWSNVLVDNNSLILLNDATSGGNVWIRDMHSEGSSNLIFSSNYLEKISHDENLGVFYGNISDVQILNNTIIAKEKDAKPSIMNITLGSEGSVTAKNILFQGNDLTTSSLGGVIWSEKGENIRVIDNVINYTKSPSAEEITITAFRGTIDVFDGNEITYNIIDDGPATTYLFYRGPDTITNNTIITNGNIDYLTNQSETFSGNTVTTNGKVSTLINAVNTVEDNIITINNHVNSMFRWATTLTSNINVNRNNINYTYTENRTSGEMSTFLALSNATLNNYTINFTGNTITAPNLNIYSSRLLYLLLKDSTAQNITFTSNTLGEYTRRQYIHSGNLTTHNITIN